MDPFKSLWRELNDSSVSKIEISAAPPFVKLIFDKAELLAALQGQSQISDLVSKCFVRRRVFWEDVRKEVAAAVESSLQEVEAELNEVTARFATSTDVAMIGIARFVRPWAGATSLVGKKLSDDLRQIREEKASTLGYESAGEDRYEALSDALIGLRQRIYPLLTIIVALLSVDDPTKREAQKYLDSGLSLVPDAALQRGCVPDVAGT
jgi:hypothetical protein